jgi:hypothetical protein
MAESAFAELETKGIRFACTSTLRLVDEQIALFAQGRQTIDVVNALRAKAKMYKLTPNENLYTVTNCDGIKTKSRHQDGRALDVVPSDNGHPIWPKDTDSRWRQIAEVMVKHGFKWGMDWNGDGKTRCDGDKTEVMLDAPHYEVPL